MASVELRSIERLLAEIDRLEKDLSRRDGKVNQVTHSDVLQLLAKSGNGTGVDAGRWSQLSAAEHNEWLKRLTKVRDELSSTQAAQSVVPPVSESEADKLSKQTMIWLALFALVFIATLLSLLR